MQTGESDKRLDSEAFFMVELISLHIPKTAGSSFFKSLISVYGKNAVLRIDIPIHAQKGLDGKPQSGNRPDRIPPKTKVIHGHFRYSELMKAYDLAEDIPVITWLRDPVSRVLSNYFYLKNVLREKITHSGQEIGPFNRMIKTLLEFAKLEREQNRLSRFVHETPLDKFKFIGIQEFFTDEIADLAYLLEWDGYEEFYLNISGAKKEAVNSEDLQEIRRLNNQDVTLYNDGLQLREKRRKRLENLGAYPIHKKRPSPSPKNSWFVNRLKAIGKRIIKSG